MVESTRLISFRLQRLNLAYNSLFYNGIPQSLRINQLFCVPLCFIFKEQFDNESVKLRQTEEAISLKEKKYESIIAIKEDEIRHLKEILNFMPVPSYEKEVRMLKHTQI